MPTPFIYLGGPIHNDTFVAGNGWRVRAEQLLAPEFAVLNPLRAREYAGVDYSQYSDEEIVTRDLMDIRRSRAVLRYVPGPSHGSDMETFYAAHDVGLPVVTFGPGQSDRRNLSLWLRRHTVKNFECLEDAVAYLKGAWRYPDDGVSGLTLAEPSVQALPRARAA